MSKHARAAQRRTIPKPIGFHGTVGKRLFENEPLPCPACKYSQCSCAFQGKWVGKVGSTDIRFSAPELGYPFSAAFQERYGAFIKPEPSCRAMSATERECLAGALAALKAGLDQ